MSAAEDIMVCIARFYQGVHQYPGIQTCVSAPFEGVGTGWG